MHRLFLIGLPTYTCHHTYAYLNLSTYFNLPTYPLQPVSTNIPMAIYLFKLFLFVALRFRDTSLNATKDVGVQSSVPLPATRKSWGTVCAMWTTRPWTTSPAPHNNATNWGVLVTDAICCCPKHYCQYKNKLKFW